MACGRRRVVIVVLGLAFALWGCTLLVSTAGPLPGTAVAHAQPAGPPDCDNDADPNTDQNEFSECYTPPPVCTSSLHAASTLRGPLAQVADCQPKHLLDQPTKDGVKGNTVFAWGGGMVACIAGLGSTFIPGAQAATPFLIGACWTGVIATAGGAAVLAVDPLDTNYTAIALPQTVPKFSVGGCRTGGRTLRRAVCRALQNAVRAYNSAASAVASLYEALATTANRYSAAAAVGSTQYMDLQRGVAETYEGLLVPALQAESQAGRTLGSALRRAGLDLTLGGRALGNVEGQLAKLKGLPKSVLRRLSSEGFTRAQIKQVVKVANGLLKARHIRRLDLARLLGTSPSTAALTTLYNNITLLELAEMIGSLTSTGQVSTTANLTLNNDLQNAQLACSPAERTQAVQQFITDAGSMVGGGYAGLIQAAALPLTVYHPPAANTPPVAAFTPSATSGSVSGFTNAISFTDGSTDPDGGLIVCHAWNFGDPSSGASNTSTDANPSHTFAAAGTYTVTETVTDSDGFAQTSTSQQITITP